MWAVVHQGRADDVVIVGRQTIERWPFDGSSIAGAAVAWVGLRVDPAAALAEIEDALEMSRRIDYPIGIAVNLRSRAFAQLLLDDADAARATIAALLDDVLERGAMSHARLVIDVAAVLAHRIGDPSWAQLASTAAVLPTATLVGAGYDLMPLPAGGARPLGRREAIATVVRLLATTPPIAEATPSTGARGADEASPSLVERGPVWEMGYRGRVVTVRASKGLADLAVLLAAPGREHHCLDLTGAGTQEASTGEVIDAAARRAYESRIRDLQEEVDDAELAHDLARAERAQVELDALVDHLMAATGRGGRTRQTSGTAERARTAVTQRLRSTMRQLADAHPELGRHLQASVTTGLYCSYTPPDDTTWNVQRAPSR